MYPCRFRIASSVVSLIVSRQCALRLTPQVSQLLTSISLRSKCYLWLCMTPMIHSYVVTREFIVLFLCMVKSRVYGQVSPDPKHALFVAAAQCECSRPESNLGTHVAMLWPWALSSAYLRTVNELQNNWRERERERLWHHVVLWTDADVSEERAATIFKVEVCRFRNWLSYTDIYMATTYKHNLSCSWIYTIQPWTWRHCVPSKRWYPPRTLNGAWGRLSRQCGILNISRPYRLPRPVTGIALFIFIFF
jgi:hypothetical protein